MTSSGKVYKVVASIPQGKVLTYGLVAKMTGLRSPRLVGKFLHNNPDPSSIPCHRVVNARGEIAKTFAFGGEIKQAELLQNEGIKIVEGKLNLKEYLWK